MTNETQWLSESDQAVWRSFLTAHNLLFTALERDLSRDSGLNLAYYEILVRLSEAPNHTLRMGELAGSVNSSRSRLSHAVSRLEEAGLVERNPVPEDQRGLTATLTAQGLTTLEQAAPQHVASVREHLFAQLTPEQVKALGTINQLLVDHLCPPPKNPVSCPDPE